MDKNISLRIARNTAANISGNVFSRLFDILTFLLLARYLGVDDFGKFSFAFAFVSLFSMLVDLGTNFILVRKTSTPGPNTDALLGSGATLRLFLSFLAIIAALAFIFLLHYPLETRILVILASFSLLVSFRMPSFREVFEVPLIASLKMKYSALAAVLNRILTFLAVLVAIYFKAPLWVIVILYTAVSLPSFFLLVSFSRKIVKPIFNIDLTKWKGLLREGFPLALGGAFFILISQMDMFLLSLFWSEREIGFYSASRRITEPLEFIPVALSYSIIPVMARLFENSMDKVRKIFEQSLLFLLLAVVPLVVFLSHFSKSITSLLFGESFLPAWKALVLLSFYLPFIFIWHIAGGVFIAVKKQKMTSFIWFTAFCVNLFLNLILIPSHDFVGASISRLATGLLVAALSLFIVIRFLGRIRVVPFLKLGFVTILLVAVLKSLGQANPVLAVVSAAVVYAGGIMVTRILSPEDIGLFKKILSSRTGT